MKIILSFSFSTCTKEFEVKTTKEKRKGHSLFLLWLCNFQYKAGYPTSKIISLK